ncbi:MAG: baseplate protein [Candidatus Marinimicrobia bacterium]|nr:baseplate protein [Candidatus Neomarinimicrobiota bacterium]|tara:strand:+ start:865 stop:1584 length:720 start_codon:yes stop_codon:yes gene_type:complete
MPLPKISTPTYELVLPSSNKKIKYRPFLVKEEKILILAMESQDTSTVANAVKDVLSSCILSRGIKVQKLSTFDIEYLFLNIRGKSVGESIEVMVTCPDDGKTQVPTSINIDEIQVKIDEKHNKDIKLDDNYSLRMRYPSLDEFVKNNFSTPSDVSVDDTFDLIASCVDQVYSEEESWAAADCTKKELTQFVESLNSSQFKEIETFFETMPKLTHSVKVMNPNTKKENEVVLEGLQNFFG